MPEPKDNNNHNHNHIDDHSNAWESAANDRLYEDALLMEEEEAATTTTTSTASRVVQACHVLDMMIGCTMLIPLILRDSFQWNQPERIGLAALGALYMLRGLLARVTPCGIALSATTSGGLALLYALVGLPVAGWYKKKQQLHLWIVLVFLAALIEALRWVWIKQWLQQESSTQLDQSFQRRRSSPWWWNSRDNSRDNPRDTSLESPLLNGQPNWTNPSRCSQSSSSTRWWPFAQRRQATNPRDDSSVDYASLNEDWASRSQEDPLWWSREEDGTQGGL